MADIEEIARIVVNTGFRISTKLGPGLMESVYETVFARDLSRQGLFVERQKRVAFDFEGLWFDEGLTVDILVERSLVIEIKSVEQFHPAHYKQLLTYLRLLDLRLGFLMNFGAASFKNGIRRVVNRL